MRLITLGTSSGKPTLERNVSAVAVDRDGEMLLFDCGEGTQNQIRRARLRLSRLSRIFITHLHGDHVNGLTGLISTLSLDGRDRPLELYSPPGIKEYIEVSRRLQIFHLRFELNITELDSAGVAYDGEEYKVICRPLDHSLFDLGYAIVEKDRPGTFDVEKARQLGIEAGPIYRSLKAGEDVTLADGRIIKSSEVVGPPHPGKRVAYCTDTRPCQSAVELARCADLLVHEGTYADELADKATQRGHSTVVDAARIAQEAQAKRLIITHISPKHRDETDRLLAQARAVFRNCQIAYDLMKVEV